MHTVDKQLPFSDPQLEEIAQSGKRVLLVTTHRRENQGEAMRGVGRALARIAAAEPDLTIVLPVHRNPAVREAVLPAIENLPNVVVTEPMAYGEFTRMLSVRAKIEGAISSTLPPVTPKAPYPHHLANLWRTVWT